MKNIDHIIQKSEHEKELSVRPELWHRIERRLDAQPRSRGLTPYLLSLVIAASIALMVIVMGKNVTASSSYVLEDLEAGVPQFTHVEIRYVYEKINADLYAGMDPNLLQKT